MMKKLLSLLLAVLACLSFVACQAPAPAPDGPTSGPTEEVDPICGKWCAVGEDGSVSFQKDGTVAIDYDGVRLNATWAYDEENDNYRLDVHGATKTAEIRTEGELAYLSVLGNYFFKEADLDAALAAAPEMRKAEIAKALNGKTLLPVGEEISLGAATLTVSQLSLSSSKTQLIGKVFLSFNTALTYTELNSLITVKKVVWMDADRPFVICQTGSESKVEIDINDFAAGDTLSTWVVFCEQADFTNAYEKWGRVDAYVLLECAGTSYYVPLGDLS